MQITLDLNTTDHVQLRGLRALIDTLLGTTAAVSSKPAERTPTITDRDGALPPEPESLADDHSDEDADIVDAAIAAGAPQHDSAGIPWDERIHASSRATIGDGTWRRRKNTPDDLYESVMAELRGPNDEAPPPPPSDTTNDTPAPPATTVAVTAPAAVAAEPVADDTPAPPAAIDLSSFAKFVSAVNSKDVPAERKVYAALNELAQGTFGVPAFKDMLHKPNDWQMFYDMVGE